MQGTDTWNPRRYEQFLAERRQPFDDLLNLVRPVPGGRVLDLGCGTGELTRILHERCQAAETVGIDNSAKMLAKAQAFAGAGLRFELSDVAACDLGTSHDVIFSNAALQWLPDHLRLIPRLKTALGRTGQLAIQLPAMERHPTHTVAKQIATRSPYSGLLAGATHDIEVLEPERYADLLHELGFRQQHVRLQIYGHTLASTESLVEWMQGTLLTFYSARLSVERYTEFLDEYRRQLLLALPLQSPFFFGFRRILLWGQLDAD